MHVKGFLHKLLTPVMHKTRVKALSEVVVSAVCTKELKLTALGRGIETGIQERSGIQKVNRLLGNQHLLEAKEIVAKEVAHLLIGPKKHPGLIVDWTKFSNSKDAVLRAALATQGRALTIYEERHPIKKMGNRKVQEHFLTTLKKILPEDCVPIIVTDAGFHNDWFRKVALLGWDYVGRVRGLKKYRNPDEKVFYPCQQLFKWGTHKCMCLGKLILTRKNPLESYVYIVKGKLKGRKAFTKQGKIRKDKDSKGYSRAHREPWLLASSLKGRHAAKRVQWIYSCRMTIEEAFRDLKSSRYGFGLEEGKTRRAMRRDVLLLIAMLASLIAWLTGKVGEQMQLHLRFQSNSIKHRRVLSLFYLGCQLIRKNFQFPLSQIWEAAVALKNEAVI
jgi:hypothetical protein